MSVLWDRISGRAGASDSEAALVASAKRGERHAFDTLAAAYRSILRAFIAQRVGHQAADDVVQDTMIAGWSSLSRYQGRARFKSWLFAIAIHKCQDYRRSAGADVAGPLDEGLAHAGDAYAQVDLRHAVQFALSGLTPPERELIELYYFAEMTMPEISLTLGRNLNTVKYQFYKAHAKVADCLRDAEPLVANAPGSARSERERP